MAAAALTIGAVLLVGLALWARAGRIHNALDIVRGNDLRHLDLKLDSIAGGVDRLGKKIDEQGQLLHRHIADAEAHGRRRLDA